MIATAIAIGVMVRLTLLRARRTRALAAGTRPPLPSLRVREPYAVTLRDGSRAWVYPAAWLAQHHAS